MALGIRWSREIIPVKRKGTIWIMVGRPRKIGKRERNGRIARAYENPKAQVADQPHRVAVPKRFREMPEAESEIGRLMLLDMITPAQYEAGKLYRELVAVYLASLQAPSPSPPAMDLERIGLAHFAGMPDRFARAIREKYDDAFCAIGRRREQRAVAHHAVHGQPVEDNHTLALLISGLSALADHFGIDVGLKSVHVRNRH